jgi:acyl-CoA reductase-like NAD-dependent aldehyde dehydrogenase
VTARPSANAQQQWANLPIRERVRVLAKARCSMALDPDRFFREGREGFRKASVDTLTSELLPLLAGIRFLEQSAQHILSPRRLGRKGLPLWLTGIQSEVHRVPFGTILVIGPSNYPLMLAGLQTVQALAAGNSVVWKPGLGGREVAETLAGFLRDAGLPEGLLRVTDESIAAAETEIEAGVDKVFFTGSVPAGKAVLRRLAEKIIPCVVELSGCDALIALPGANMDRVVRALAFGMRLNGSSTCMAPRRLLLVGATPEQKQQLVERLLQAFQTIDPVRVTASTHLRLNTLLRDANAAGARICGEASSESMRPILLTDGASTMAIAQEDIFAPVVTLIELKDTTAVLAAQAINPFGLTASIFGKEADCRALAHQLDVGSVFINDIIVPSVDPRLSFGGRRQSGFGATQGVEGLLEMTAIKTITTRKLPSTWHLDPMTPHHEGLFTGFIRATYANQWSDRIRGMRETIRSGRRLLK